MGVGEGVDNKKKSHFLIKQVSRRENIPAGTLIYYDSIGLCKPELRSCAGYRLYSEKDIAKLKKITFFKKLGFSLKQIKELLKEDASNITPAEKIVIIQEQVQKLQSQMMETKKAQNTLISAAEEYRAKSYINWGDFQEQTKGDFPQKRMWWSELDIPVEIKKELLECQKKLSTMYQLDERFCENLRLALLTEIKKNLSENPTGPWGRELGSKYVGFLLFLYGDNKILIWCIIDAIQQQNIMPNNCYTKSIITWIKTALEFHNLYLRPTEVTKGY